MSKQLVPVEPKYYEFMRLLRMNPKVVDGFLQTANISPEDQILYMQKYHHCYYIGLLDNEPAGYVGVINGDIRICVEPQFQGQGMGAFMLKKIVDIFPNAVGRIKKNNISSQKIFEKCKVPFTII